MHLAALWQAQQAVPPLIVATVDHALRPEARAEAEEVGHAAAQLGLPHTILTWEGEKPTTGLQDAARAARYDLLDRFALRQDATHLVTAHTLDDQAETILMRMARGSGPAGLIGMQATTQRRSLTHVRPFLAIAKARLVATCAASGWTYVQDPSNADPRFARSRWRTLMPQLAAEGLTAARLATLSQRLARWDETLAALARHAHAAAVIEVLTERRVYDAAELARQPFEVLTRLVTFALREFFGDDPEWRAPRLERIEDFAAQLSSAFDGQEPFRRTLGGALFTLTQDGRLTMVREGPRRRGMPG
ncbi:tRNA lysidine(34) synthetase TilS [Methylovirgula sp. 4M-Z18]|nr:tRNA lysidine(34) synthetase TilS [Methylovirgula sp. 4M-Z18]